MNARETWPAVTEADRQKHREKIAATLKLFSVYHGGTCTTVVQIAKRNTPSA